MDSKTHPALAVSNIKTHIPIMLEQDSAQYTTWSTLFQVQCRVFEVADHLSPPPAAAASSSTTNSDQKADDSADKALWQRIDAVVLQWIYATISPALLQIILSPGQTAYKAWTVLKNQFNDNKTTRAVFLGQEFAHLSLESFSSMTEYCQRAKHLADQLKAVGSPVDENMLVIKILTGLMEQYDSISTVLQNRDPLPDFNEVRSRLTMEEDKKKRQTARAAQHSATALTASVSSHSSSQTPNYYPASDRGHGRSRGRGRGRGRNYNNRNYNNRGPQTNTPAHPYIVFPSNWTANQWASLLNGSPSPSAQTIPPCPYPSKPNTPSSNSQGILGPRPDQITPTDIEQALYTMALNQPDHGVMDTGATSHSARYLLSV
ncbi:uncharacterized protein LOC110896237 [Helianthus annuus]|uniref:uncharacterized protein LOC110896237 n=1 Tax=Helianthus annuus TaxID=4232 RepID=UPI000B907485|nr:uncharacterized protein LOC110896237 [Helianthus annuus]